MIGSLLKGPGTRALHIALATTPGVSTGKGKFLQSLPFPVAKCSLFLIDELLSKQGCCCKFPIVEPPAVPLKAELGMRLLFRFRNAQLFPEQGYTRVCAERYVSEVADKNQSRTPLRKK